MSEFGQIEVWLVAEAQNRQVARESDQLVSASNASQNLTKCIAEVWPVERSAMKSDQKYIPEYWPKIGRRE